jgi:gliding motility-associated-like protein
VGDILNNPAQPDPQAIDSVSVDPLTGLVTVCWSPNTSLNVVEYNVYWNPDQFAWDLLATVPGYNTTCWTDPTADPQSGSIWYQVTATNNCGQEGLAAGSGAAGTNRSQTIFLQDSVDGCLREAYLTWTPYWYWPQGVSEYEIYSSKDGQPYALVGTVSGSETTFTHEGLEEEATYCHYVRAVQNNAVRVTATSNAPCSYVYVPKRPDYDYNYNTTVQADNSGVEEYFFVDSTAGYIGFQIQRGRQPDDMRDLWFIPFDPSTRFYQYIDAGARPAFYSYYYSVIGVDSCEMNADTMNMSRTILLAAEAHSNRTNSLEWNHYEGWNGGVAAYNIHRSVDGVYQYLTTVPPTQLTYLDSIQEIIIGEGNFCYYIEAVEGISDPIGTPDPVLFQELSRSNEDCARQHPNVFTPNAFMPEGVNNVFKPVTVYVDADSYLLQIYNRWGQRIFETTDPNEGWNGSSGGKKEPQGAYAYFVKFVSSRGEEYTKSGTITLIR